MAVAVLALVLLGFLSHILTFLVGRRLARAEAVEVFLLLEQGERHLWGAVHLLDTYDRELRACQAERTTVRRAR